MDIVFYRSPGSNEDALRVNRYTKYAGIDLQQPPDDAKNASFKFLIIEQTEAEQAETRRVIGCIFGAAGEPHSVVAHALLKDGGKFVGAGRYYSGGPAEWGSSTCVDVYGSDRPKDREVATTTLKDFQKSFEELYGVQP